MERVAHFQSLLLQVSLVPHKSCPDKKFHPSLEGARKGMSLHVPWNKTPISRALLSISFWVPSKGALPPGSLHRAPTERGAPFPETSFIRLSKSLVNEHPLRTSSGAPMEMPFSRTFLYIRRGTARTLPKLLCCSMYCLFCILCIVCV